MDFLYLVDLLLFRSVRFLTLLSYEKGVHFQWLGRVSWRSARYVFAYLPSGSEPEGRIHMCTRCFLGRRKRTMVVSRDCSPPFSRELVIVTFAYILLSKLSPWLNLMSMG